MSWNRRGRMPRTMGELFEEMNQFTLARQSPEPEDPPEVSCRTWSNVFGKGGSVRLEARVDGKSVELADVRVETNHDARAAHEDVADIIEEWNENPRACWKRAVEASREKVLDYSRRQLKEHEEKIARYEAGDWQG